MKKNTLISIISIVIIYFLISTIVDKSYLIPKITEIIYSLKNIIINPNFIIIVSSTLLRTFIGVFISFVIGVIFSCLSYRYKFFEELFNPLYIILKTIPNITYIIVALIWLGRSGSVILVSSTVVFPIIYNSILASFKNIDSSLIEYTSLFDYSFFYKLKEIYIPLIKQDILHSVKNSLSLAFKVSIMAEILSQIKNGIGRELYYAKSNFLMSDIFAWTIIIIIISYTFDLLLNKLIKKAEY